MLDDRDESGRFLKGMWRGGPGRAAKAKEEKYRGIFTEVVDAEKFRASCLQVWLDSIGKKLDKDGKMIEDADSTPATRVNAFSRIAAYALGRSIQPVLLDSAEGDILAIFREMSEEKLDQIIGEAQRVLANGERLENLPAIVSDPLASNNSNATA